MIEIDDLISHIIKADINKVKVLVQKVKLWESGADGVTPMMAAARKGDDEILKYLLSEMEGMDFGEKAACLTNNGKTALMEAVKHDHLGCVRLLTGYGLEDLRERESGNTPLMGAVIKKNVEMVKILLRHGSPNVQKREGETALHLAAEKGDAEIIKVLLAAGANPEMTNERWRTPLFSAVLSNDHGGLYELKKVSNLSHRDMDKLTALELAGYHAKLAVLVSLKHEMNGESAKRVLRMVLTNDSANKEEVEDTALFLLKAGIEFENDKDRDETVVQAIRIGASAVVKKLIEDFGFSYDYRDAAGNGVLAITASSGSLDTLKVIMSKLDMETLEKIKEREMIERRPSFIRAAKTKGGNVECVEYLLNNGCGICLNETLNGYRKSAFVIVEELFNRSWGALDTMLDNGLSNAGLWEGGDHLLTVISKEGKSILAGSKEDGGETMRNVVGKICALTLQDNMDPVSQNIRWVEREEDLTEDFLAKIMIETMPYIFVNEFVEKHLRTRGKQTPSEEYKEALVRILENRLLNEETPTGRTTNRRKI